MCSILYKSKNYDTGDITCKLDDVLKNIKINDGHYSENKKYIMYSLKYIDKLKIYRNDIHKIILYIEDLNKNNQVKNNILESVSKWIYNNNKFEFCGLDTETDTLNYLTLRTKTIDKSKERDVYNTYELLKESYIKPNENINNIKVNNYIVDVLKIKKYHSILMNGDDTNLLIKPGKFRKCGVFTNMNNKKHIYPHHKIIKKSIENLLFLVNNISKYIDNTYVNEDCDKVLNIFCLAGFLQFHFVDIHPFSDGNGRICRLLSKRILDSILPLPISFENRDDYIKNIEDGRLLDGCESPIYLTESLIKNTLQYYENIVAIKVLCVSNIEELNTQIYNFNDDDKKIIIDNFNKLEEGEIIEFKLHIYTIKLKKLYNFEYIDDL